jgi:hypothetical protein
MAKAGRFITDLGAGACCTISLHRCEESLLIRE